LQTPYGFVLRQEEINVQLDRSRPTVPFPLFDYQCNDLTRFHFTAKLSDDFIDAGETAFEFICEASAELTAANRFKVCVGDHTALGSFPGTNLMSPSFQTYLLSKFGSTPVPLQYEQQTVTTPQRSRADILFFPLQVGQAGKGTTVSGILTSKHFG
jgi:hypothetical protein